MKHFIDERQIVVILERGEELINALSRYAKQKELAGAWIQSGVGGSGSAVLSFYDLQTRTYIDTELNGPLEILSLSGNLAWNDDEPFWHIHGVFGTNDFRSVGGHIKKLEIALTAEILLSPLGNRLSRVYDETTGLKLL